MKIFNVKFAALAIISLISVSIGLASCSSKPTQDSENIESEAKTFSPEVIRMSELNWQEYDFMDNVNGQPYPISVVCATIPTDKEPLVIAVSNRKIFLQGNNFGEQLENLTVSNGRESHKIHWDKNQSDNYHIIITAPESYANLIKVLDKGEFDLTINKTKVHVSSMGRGVEYAVINKLKN